MSWIRLRQVALVAHDLDAVSSATSTTRSASRSRSVTPQSRPSVCSNAVLPVGNQFIEVVSPTKEGTAGGRQLDRLGGDGGYMVICHTDDHDARAQAGR